MPVGISIHAGKNHDNPHAHILLTTRSIGKDGSWLAKQKRNYLLDENGNRIKDPITNRYRLGWSIKINDWDDVKYIEKWRKSWADMCNEQFRQLGIPKEVTHMSYKRQGIDKESTKHLGAKVKALEDRGIKTRRGDENRMIEKRNREKELRRIWDRLEQSREMVRDFDR